MPSLLSFHDQQHITRMFVQEQRVNVIFNQFVSAIAPEMRRWKDAGNKNSVWVRNPGIEKTIDRSLIWLQSNLEKEIKSGQTKAWEEAVLKNDKFVESYIKGMSLSSIVKDGMFKRNLDALELLQNRTENGLNLSQRVWNITGQTKGHIETFLESGIASGRSADAISRDFRQLLNNPDKRFRRVRNAEGKLVFSQPMKDYHPGRGVYRSSKMNAIRVSATETNMGYRVSDSERWKQLDFVLGFEVKRSRNGHPCAVCDALVGRYPKDFIFPGWHPFCICIAVPIVLEHEDFADFLLTDQIPANKYVRDIPTKALEWMNNYTQKTGSVPYFVKKNESILSKPIRKIHYKTAEEKADIQKRWDERRRILPDRLSVNMPEEFRPKSAYLHGEDYIFDKKFFDLIDSSKPVGLSVSKQNEGAYYSPSERKVYLFDASRNAASNWERKAVVYHEFGHAIDWQRDLRYSQELKNLRVNQIRALKKQSTYTIWSKSYNYQAHKYELSKIEKRMSRVAYIDRKLEDLGSKIFNMKKETFEKRGITKYDVLEQVGSVRDTIKSLVISYGDGHTTAYFKLPGMSEAEYIAHAFENAYICNRVFEKYLPDIYNEMIAYIHSLK